MPKRTVLEIINLDNSAIAVETTFEKKPYLDVQLAPGQVLVPSTKEAPIKLEIPIIFTPREIKKYQETISFEFNNLYTIDVTITGEGIPMQLELVDPEQAIVDFGVVSVGGDVTRTIPLVNKSKKPVTF
jgi:hydrocephalus-inducing protein